MVINSAVLDLVIFACGVIAIGVVVFSFAMFAGGDFERGGNDL